MSSTTIADVRRAIILIGAGALARDMIDCFGPESFAGIYVDPQFPAQPIHGVPVYTDWEQVRRVAGHFMLSISDVAHRERAQSAALANGLQAAPAMVAPTAVVARDAVLAPGSSVGQMVVIGPSARLEEHALVMHASIVAHDTVVGKNSVICAGVCLGGGVQIGARTFVGANAMLAPGMQLGDDVYVAAGSACFRHAESGSRWIGNPARRSKAGTL